MLCAGPSATAPLASAFVPAGDAQEHKHGVVHGPNLWPLRQVIAALHEAAVADPGRARRSSSFSRTISARNSAFGRLSASGAAVPASVLV